MPPGLSPIVASMPLPAPSITPGRCTTPDPGASSAQIIPAPPPPTPGREPPTARGTLPPAPPPTGRTTPLAAAFTWVNQELQAVFDSTGINRAITVSGKAIAHGLTFNSGATSYSFNGGSLTVTTGGIIANEGVTINSPLYIGGPQSWNVASGRTLSVTGSLHTIISDLTFSGAGNTTISSTIDGGGTINAVGGVRPGGLIQAGAGTVTLSGATTFHGNITAQAAPAP